MKIFVIKVDGKEVSRENVSDCKTVEEYANRKYGSFDYKAAKHDITMLAPAAKPAAPVKPAEAPEK
jgi:hypothetical protein